MAVWPQIVALADPYEPVDGSFDLRKRGEEKFKKISRSRLAGDGERPKDSCHLELYV